jgi:hypothetical protein
MQTQPAPYLHELHWLQIFFQLANNPCRTGSGCSSWCWSHFYLIPSQLMHDSNASCISAITIPV